MKMERLLWARGSWLSCEAEMALLILEATMSSTFSKQHRGL